MEERQPHVVVIEDNVTTNNLLRDWLKLSYRVTCFLDAESLRKLLAPSEDPVVFVLDYNLPGEDGLSLQSFLNENFPAGKTILISGLFDSALTEQAEAAGVARTLPKPFALPALDEHIRELLGLPDTKTNLVDLAKSAEVQKG